MVKLVNILILTAFLFACKKDKVQVPTYLDADVSFLYGDWKFIKGAFGTDAYNYPSEFYYEQDINCVLSFEPNGKLTINCENNSTIQKLKLTGLIEQDDFKIVFFRDSSNKKYRFSLTPSLNILECEQDLFQMPNPICFEIGEQKFTHYEKL